MAGEATVSGRSRTNGGKWTTGAGAAVAAGPVTTSGLLAGLTFGGVVGLLYALSPYRSEVPG